MRKCTLILIVLMGSLQGYTQPNFYTGFETDMARYYPTVEPGNAVYVMELQNPQWAEGISGRALNLSEHAVLRKPLVLDSLETPDYSKGTDLSVQVWVKTLKGAHQGTPIIGNLKEDKTEEAGWSIFSLESGAWGVVLSDGETSYTYQANAPRQAINDGQWHQLAFCLNREKEEVWYYLDGKNVAIYNLSGLGNLVNGNRTVVGGSDEYWEYGSSGQWTAFNGYIDEVSIRNSFENAENIRKEFRSYGTAVTAEKTETLISPIRTMTWNIWHGGRRYGKHVGVERVVETIREARPDVVGLIETYGSGEVIADSLDYYFYLISSNLSILSRFPIKETIKAFRSFNFGGAVLDLGNNRELMILDTWLHYLPDYSSSVVNMEKTAKELVNDEKETRHSEIQTILKEIKPLLKNKDQVPVLMMGDFNSGSHLDWTEETKKIHYNYIIEWPVSREMEEAGFKDSFRELNINPLLDPGLTWTPRAATSSAKYGLRDRIDYIYYMGDLKPIESKVIDYHPIMFPSDHAAVLSIFKQSRSR